MPINETNSLSALLESLQYFYKKTGTRVTFEYVMLQAENDTQQDAEELADFARKIPSKINLIEYNPIDGGIYQKSSGNAMHRFKAILEEKGCIVNIRRSRGEDIDAACGQLANKHQ